ncbi:MAG: ATP-binding protein, partial [Clostridia bacterium]
YIEGKAYYLSIADNGPMIPEEIKNKIFDNGFSTKDNNKPDHGFGLFIVNELIKQHSGEIKVLSSEEETEFLIKFKVRKDKDAKDCSKDYKRDTA